MATLSPPSPTKQTTTTGEHLGGERALLFMLLTVHSCLVMHISWVWDDLVSLASAGVTYVAVGLLLGRFFGCWVARQLDAIIWILFLSLGVLQVSRLARIPAAASWTSVPMLVAVAGAAALGVGGCCAYMLHRRSWSKQQRQEVIFLKLRQDPRN